MKSNLQSGLNSLVKPAKEKTEKYKKASKQVSIRSHSSNNHASALEGKTTKYTKCKQIIIVW